VACGKGNPAISRLCKKQRRRLFPQPVKTALMGMSLWLG
jgi:hypothetical protein